MMMTMMMVMIKLTKVSPSVRSAQGVANRGTQVVCCATSKSGGIRRFGRCGHSRYLVHDDDDGVDDDDDDDFDDDEDDGDA